MRHTRTHRIHDAIASIPPRKQRAGRVPVHTGHGPLWRSTGRRPSCHPATQLSVVLGVVVQKTLLKHRPLARGEGAENALQVLHRGELDDDLALLLAQVDLHPGLEAVREPGREFTQRRGEPGTGTRPLGASEPLCGSRTHEGHDLLDRSHREPLGHDPVSQPVLLLGVLHGQQRPCVPGRQHPGGHPALDRRRELQQTQRVGDLRTGPADAVRQLVVRAVEVLEQLVVGGGLFQRVQLGTVQVLQQRVQEQLLVVRGPDDRRDAPPARPHGRPASAAHP